MTAAVLPAQHFDAGLGAMAHEVGHVLGLLHTHQRPDRDSHVHIYEDYIDPEFAHAFQVQPGQVIGPYDTESVMHYSSYAFTTAPCATISRGPEAVDPCELTDDRDIFGADDFSPWNNVVLSALYCDPRFCGDNCASESRCSTETVRWNLERLRYWEETGLQMLPASRAVCGDHFVDGGEECDGSRDCTATCELVLCGDGVIEGEEECEEGGRETAQCDVDCTRAVCSDNIVNRSAGEECELHQIGCNYDCHFESKPAASSEGCSCAAHASTGTAWQNLVLVPLLAWWVQRRKTR